MVTHSYGLTPAHRLSFPLPDIDVRQLAEAQRRLAVTIDPETTWRTATYSTASGWSNYDASYALRYRRMGRWVFIQGLGRVGVRTAGTVLFNLTWGFRPIGDLRIMCAANGTPIVYKIGADGNVSIELTLGPSAVWASLDSIHFLAEDNYPPI